MLKQDGVKKMFEYHGWITINNTNFSNNNETLEKKTRKISRLVEKHKDSTAKIDIFYQKGQTFIRFDGSLEHYKAWVLKLFFAIGHIVEECEGSLFIKDEENPCLSNQFQAWLMCDGAVIPCDNLGVQSMDSHQQPLMQAV